LIVLNIVVRNVDENAFRNLKVKAVEEGLSLGKAITQAIRAWVNKPLPPKRRAPILDFKPVDCGPGSERTSMEIDKIVYGAEL